MSKSHIVKLTIVNNTGLTFSYVHAWFQSGEVDGNNWPTTIEPNSQVTIECYASTWILPACSGWVQYSSDDISFYFCFSNPTSGSNGIDIGINDSVWNDMTGHYFTVQRYFNLNDNHKWLTANITSSGGGTNNAVWELGICDTSIVTPSNLEMNNVESVFNQISNTGSRQYYKCDNRPTSLEGIAVSHFKGIASFAGNLIFTHTNLTLIGSDNANGKYLIGHKITVGNQGAISGVYDTTHNPPWPHPCSSQACGSFMAMGIQASASGPGSNISEIQIYDIRMAQVGQPITLLGSIPRNDIGINGVAITQQNDSGKYIVAGVNGLDLSLYISNGSNLLDLDDCTFKPIKISNPNGYDESGAGLALVTQTDGTIYLFAFNANDDGSNNHMCLYKIDIDAQQPTATAILTKVQEPKDMPIPGISDSINDLEKELDVLPSAITTMLTKVGTKYLNSSFRWGKGLAITSANTVEVYATDRNVLPLVSSDKNFSLVVWSNDQP